jgi:hypothetical protein
VAKVFCAQKTLGANTIHNFYPQVVTYFVLMGWFAQIYHVPRLRLYYIIGFILLGRLLEILQGLGGIRQMDWIDMLANSIGVLVAWQLTKNRLMF